MRAKAAGITGYAQANAFQRADELEEEAVKSILDAAEVVACTCVGAGGKALLERKFAVVVLDEATQATEPDSLIPILKVRGHLPPLLEWMPTSASIFKGKSCDPLHFVSESKNSHFSG